VAEVVARGKVRTYDLDGTATTAEMARAVGEALRRA
jgi:isocitrate/isopropylmalate dehydrogenase